MRPRRRRRSHCHRARGPQRGGLPGGMSHAQNTDLRRGPSTARFEGGTEIQQRCWAACATPGRDVLAVGPTGSGKTLGYLLPLAAAFLDAPAAGSRDSWPAAGLV